MASREEIEILKKISSDDIKKYRPDLFSSHSDIPYLNEDDEISTDESSKKHAGCGIYIIISLVLIGLLFILIPIAPNLFTQGRIYHYLMLWGMMSLLWFQLPDGELTARGQLVIFCIIPLLEFLFIQLLGISNWWGLLFIIAYGVIISIKYNIDLNDNNPPISGATTGKIIGSVIKGSVKGMSSSRRKR